MKKIIGILLCLCVSWGSVSEIALAATQNSTDTIVKEQQTEKNDKEKTENDFYCCRSSGTRNFFKGTLGTRIFGHESEINIRDDRCQHGYTGI